MPSPRRRPALVVAAALLVASACGSGDDATAGGPTTSPPGAVAGPGTTGAGGDGAAPPPGSPDESADGGDPAPSVETAATAPSPGDPTTVVAPPATLDGRVDVGAFAPAILRPDASERVVVEVHADVAPRSATLDHVRSVLEDATGKAVDVDDAGAPGGGDRSWDGGALVAAADAGGTAPAAGTAVLRLLFVHGTYGGDDSVLGVAVRGDTAAVFLDRVAAAGGLLGNAGPVEASVTTHELGHLLGLVDLHLRTGRADPEHPGHSPNRGSVMYWAVESDVIGQLLGADPPADFDAADRADLAAIAAGG